MINLNTSGVQDDLEIVNSNPFFVLESIEDVDLTEFIEKVGMELFNDISGLEQGDSNA